MDNEKICSCSCSVWPASEMPEIENPIDKSVHFCTDPIAAILYERNEDEDDGDCIGRKDGSFWIVNSEYGDTQVKFCPHCGVRAPRDTKSTRD